MAPKKRAAKKPEVQEPVKSMEVNDEPSKRAAKKPEVQEPDTSLEVNDEPSKRAAKKPEVQEPETSLEMNDKSPKLAAEKPEVREPEKSSQVNGKPPKRAAKKTKVEEPEVKKNIPNARSLRARKPVDYNETKIENVVKNEIETKDVKPTKKSSKRRTRVNENVEKTSDAKTASAKPVQKASRKKKTLGNETEKVNEETASVNDKKSLKDLDCTFVVKKNVKKAKKEEPGKASGENGDVTAENGDSAEENDINGEKEEPAAKKSKGSGPKLNKVETDYSAIDFSSNKTTGDGRAWNFKISSWNVDGLRAWLKKDGLKYIEHENPDIICLQETKCPTDKIPSEIELKGYHRYWNCADKDGYSGVGLLSKIMPLEVNYGIGIEELDNEGRLICAEYEKFFLVSVYVPNAGHGLVTLPKRLEWDTAFKKFIKDLDSKKPVIICGDMNVSHKEIDLANPKTNTKNAGFTKEERQGMTDLLAEGFVDTFRMLYPNEVGAYTFWTYLRNCRAKNVGWRLDYFVVSERLSNRVCDNIVRREVYGSDHCPIALLLHV